MEILLGILCVCLLIFLLIVLYRLRSLRRNIRHFSDELEKLKSTDYAQPMKVMDFDDDIVELAVRVNEHTDIQRRLAVEYEQSKKQLGTVISGISHDFRTPLTAALGYLQMIDKSSELSGKNAGYLQIAIQKNQYLKALSDEFFELTKLESNSDGLHTEPFNLSNLLTETVLEQHDWIKQRNISTEFDIQDGIVIQSDIHYFTRILNNLMSNAQKYADESFGVMLKSDAGRITLCVYNAVSDGTSVDVNKVFEPFYRMDSRTSNGSGLGLYVVKLLCEKLGFAVSADIDGQNIFSVRIKI